MGVRFNYSGLVIAVLGFGLTRVTVTLALYDDPLRFYVAGIIPLLLGLGLAAFGVALVVANVDAQLVRTATAWCIIGTATMLVLAYITIVGATGTIHPTFTSVQSQLYLSNFLIGGSLGGTLTGLYAARSHRHRDAMEAQANRLEVLNRMLRHEVLNAITLIRGYAGLAASNPDATSIIQDRADEITQTIDDVRYLAQRTTSHDTHSTVDLIGQLEASLETITQRYPEADITATAPDRVDVVASDRLEQALTQLLENAILHTNDDDSRVEISVETTATRASITIQDAGPGLPEAQQALLESGEITEFDDPRDGYGLNVVRLIVESFDGRIQTDVSEHGTTISLELRRPAASDRSVATRGTGLLGLRVHLPELLVILAAAVLAGVAYGVVSEHLGGSVAAIGVFYGISDPVVGWITHQFHSAVFAFMYAGLLTLLPARYHDHLPAYIAVGIGWGLLLWLGAASIIAPIWLNLLGIPVPIPNLTTSFLATHLAWGTTLGTFTGLGIRHLTPTH